MRKTLLLFISVGLVLLFSAMGGTLGQCTFSANAYCKCPTSTILNCANFGSFGALNFSQASADDPPQRFDFIQLEPAQTAPLDSSLNLQGIELNNNNGDLEVSLSHIEFIQWEANPFRLASNIGKLVLSRSSFEFRYLAAPLSQQCSLASVDVNSSGGVPLLASFARVFLDASVVYEASTCPLAFKNARIQTLVASNMSRSNRLAFMDNLSIVGEQLDSRVTSLEVYSSQIGVLDSRLLNKYVFRYLQHVAFIDSRVESAEERVFAAMPFLQTIQFKLANMDVFMRNVSWTRHLSGVDRATPLLVGLIDLAHSYLYPDEDLCMYKEFPHAKGVFVYIQYTNEVYACTCTLVWLLQNWSAYDKFNLSNPSVEKCLDAAFLAKKLAECAFDAVFSACDNAVTPPPLPPPLPAESNDSLIVGVSFVAPFVAIGVYLLVFTAVGVCLRRRPTRRVLHATSHMTTQTETKTQTPRRAQETQGHLVKLPAGFALVDLSSEAIGLPPTERRVRSANIKLKYWVI